MLKVVKWVLIIILISPALSALADEHYVGSGLPSDKSPQHSSNLLESFQASGAQTNSMSVVPLDRKKLPNVNVPLLTNTLTQSKNETIKPIESEQEMIQEDFKNLIQQNTTLKKRVNELTQEIKHLRENPSLTDRFTPHLKTSPKNQLNTASKNTHFLKNSNFILSMGTVLISIALLLLLILILPRKSIPIPSKKKFNKGDLYKKQMNSDTPQSSSNLPKKKEIKEEQNDLDTEYDFMNSEDAIPVRLDLARAYLEMDQFTEAKEALQPVLEKGSDSDKQEARSLLKEIEAAQNKGISDGPQRV